MPIVPNMVRGEDGECHIVPETRPKYMSDTTRGFGRPVGVFESTSEAPPGDTAEALYSHHRLNDFREIYSFLEANHKDDEIIRFLSSYIRPEAVRERGRLLLGRKFLGLDTDFLDLIELANATALRFAEHGDVNDYWFRQYGFSFLRTLATWDFRTLRDIADVLERRQELQNQGICDAKGNSRITGKGKDRIGEKELILKFVNEQMRDASRLPSKQEVIAFLRSEGRSVGKNFYSERLLPLGLDGLPDNSGER